MIDALESLEARRESPDDVLRRKRAWDHHATGWVGRLSHMIYEIGDPFPISRLLRDGVKRHQAQARLLICELGIRMHRSEHESPPEKLAELVPEYLPSVPEDPFSEKPMIYRRTASGHLLYSVGSNGIDESGLRSEDYYSGDLLLEEPSEEGEGS